MSSVMLAILMFFAGCLAGGGVMEEAEGETDGATSVVNNYHYVSQPPLLQLNGTGTECWESLQNGDCTQAAALMMVTNATTSIEIVAMWSGSYGHNFRSNCTSQTRSTGVGAQFLLSDGGSCQHYMVFHASHGLSALANLYSFDLSWSILYREHVVSPQAWTHGTGYNLPLVNTVDCSLLGVFQASDASAAMTGGSGDTLLRVAWSSIPSEDLNWSSVAFTLRVGDNSYTCQVSNGDCGFSQTGNATTHWENDEIIFVTETGSNICGGGSDASCSVQINATYNGVPIPGTAYASVV